MDIGQIQDVTDSLALMPDAALQKYAMMNKNDPYIMSLAMSENNRRQKLRTAQQGQAGQMPAPKVVDQVIQSINPPPAPPPQAMPPQQAMPQAQTQLPENQGIAQIPAPNMQGMADGGIVGFDEGGTTSRFSEFFKDSPEAIARRKQFEVLRQKNEAMMKAERDRPGLFEQTTPEKIASTEANAIKAGEAYLGASRNTPAAKPAPAVKPAALTEVPKKESPPAAPPAKETQEKKAAAPKTSTGIPSLLKTDTTLSPTVMPSAGTDMGASASQTGAPETDPIKIAAEYAKIRDAYTPVNRFGKEIGELTDAEAAMHEQSKAQLLADIEKRGPAMADYEKRLKGKEERLSKKEADLPAMSITEAGLAMMAGTSPNALTNIGVGAQTGYKSYTAGLEKLAEARDKLDESFAKIEELRRSEGIANDKELRQMGKGIAQTYVKAKEMGLSALMEDGKLGRKEAENTFNTMATNRRDVWDQAQENTRTSMREAGQNARTATTTAAQKEIAQMQETGQTARSNFSAQVQRQIAAMPPAEARTLMLLGGGDLKKGMEIKQAMLSEKFNPLTSYADYLKGFAGKETITPPLSYADYVSQFQGPKLVNVAPASLKP